MRGLLTALATASHRGVINVDLRSGHMMYDAAGTTSAISRRYLGDISALFPLISAISRRYLGCISLADRTFRLTDWDNAVAVAEAAGRDAEFPRDGAVACALHAPAVPVHIWGEMLPSGSPTTVAPESLFSWLDGGRAGCRFTPALDIWHAGDIPLIITFFTSSDVFGAGEYTYALGASSTQPSSP